MANKINEIIGVINNGEVDEELSARVDNLEDNLNSFEEQTNQIVSNLENWIVVSDESDIFDTVDGKKYFKHDTFLYFNELGSRIHGYFIKGFPKADIKIDFTFVDSDTDHDFTYVYDNLYVNNDSFKLVEETSSFDFNESPVRTNYNRELRDLEYGTSYNDTGGYGKIIMFVRSIEVTET